MAVKYLEPVIKTVKEKGYEVRLIYISLESEQIALSRIAQRVRKGGHDVPSKDVIRRYKTGKKRFWDIYRHLVDDWYVYDNSNDDFDLFVHGRGSDFEVIKKSIFKRFISDIS